MSESKITNEGSKSITFEAIKDESLVEMDNIKVGMKMDLYEENKKIWIPATVKQLERRNLNILFLTINLNGFPAEFDQNI